MSSLCRFFFHASAPPATYTLSLHDALPICAHRVLDVRVDRQGDNLGPRDHDLTRGHVAEGEGSLYQLAFGRREQPGDRKSTRLNSSHMSISYAVFCLKKKTPTQQQSRRCS